MLATSDPLIRFVTDGLMATIDSYLAGALPLHRFAWELSARVETLSSLDAPTRTLTRLRWLLRTVELVHAAQSARAGRSSEAAAARGGVRGVAGAAARGAAVGPGACGAVARGVSGAAGNRPAPDAVTAFGLTRDEENTLTVALADFRAVLATLVPHNPLDPAGAARPATVLAVVA
jgi:hypothetical protein